ncbi:MAG: hypothetical protein PF694_14695 [Bacteroidetes bacterium]|jgi:drug/metabolite transporter (DMT)-like permease|nr:hypothetical protein [Bacteroidota bacterium]
MEEGIKQLALISSVLGGFSFTFLSAIFAIKARNKIKFSLIIVITIASMSFLLAAIGWSMFDFLEPTDNLQSHHQMLVKLLLVGLITLISALGLSGWLNDLKTGITTVIISLLTLAILFLGILRHYLQL